MIKYIRVTVTLFLVGILICTIAFQSIKIEQMNEKYVGIKREFDMIKCRIMDNGDRIFYLEQEVGTSYGESGEY